MDSWFVEKEVAPIFPNHSAAICCRGERINGNLMSRLIKYRHDDDFFFIKTYFSRGRWLRHYMGRSRIRAEWENLQEFAVLGIPTADLVAYGESLINGIYKGTLITREVEGTYDLATILQKQRALFANRTWRSKVLALLSATVRKMHKADFVHNDLKWRNILVETINDASIYVIDCPLGKQMSWPFLKRGKIKDLACLDKIARKELSKNERLRFYLTYKGKKRLEQEDKKEIARVLQFFSGRQ